MSLTDQYLGEIKERSNELVIQDIGCCFFVPNNHVLVLTGATGGTGAGSGWYFVK
jgi:hypothetical protein